MSESRLKMVGWIVAGLVVFMVFGNQGFRDLASRMTEKRRLAQSLKGLHGEHARLSQELSWIRQDPAYSEYLIRKNLGYVKKGEVEYRFIKKEKSPKTP